MKDHSVRNLVSVREVVGVESIPDADAIEAVKVGGWTVVSKKGVHRKGDLVVYFEIDSALPLKDERYSFLRSRGCKTIDGEDYHILKTAKLRGVYSQGLILPLSEFPELSLPHDHIDLSEHLGIFKYEPPIPAELSGLIEGAFPTHLVSKTDSERVQNLTFVFPEILEKSWIPTEKIDGTSVTIIKGKFGSLRVCSRNWELKRPEQGQSPNSLWNIAFEVENLMNLDSIVQGELFGEGIQGNRLRIKGRKLAIFNVIEAGRTVPREEWDLLGYLAAPTYNLTTPQSVDEAVEQANGIKSLVNPQRLAEGIVWHTTDGSVIPELGRNTWKAISNKYLEKEN